MLDYFDCVLCVGIDMLETRERVKEKTKIIRLGRLQTALITVCLILFVGWCGLIASLVFVPFQNFSPDWQKFTEYESGFYLDIITKLPRNLEYFLATLFFVASAIGPGHFLLLKLKIKWRDEFERTIFALASGLLLFTFVTMLVGVLGLLQKKVFFPLLILASISTFWYISQIPKRHWVGRLPLKTSIRLRLTKKNIFQIGLILLLFACFYLSLLGGLTPETQFDGRHYHLGPPKHYAQKDQLYNTVAETGMFGAAYPPYQHMLYTALIEMFGLISAKLLHWVYALLTVLALIYFCYYHFRSVLMGLVGGLIFIGTPVVLWAAGTANTDLPLCFYGLLAIHAFLRWKEDKTSARWLILIGMTSGYATGVKTFGFFGLILLVPAIIIFSCHEQPDQISKKEITHRLVVQLTILGITVLLVCIPWLIRTYLLTGNPVFPFLNNIFNSPYWKPEIDESIKAVYLSFQTDRSVWGYFNLTWYTVMEANKYRSIFGPFFLMTLPLVFCIVVISKHKAGYLLKLLGFYLIGWLTIWFLSGATESRYTFSILPIVIIPIAFAIAEYQWQTWAGQATRLSLIAVLLVVTVWNSPMLVVFQKHATTPGINSRPGITWAYLYRDAPEVTVIVQYFPMIQYINKNLSPYHDKVLDFTAQRFLIYVYVYNDVEAMDASFLELVGLFKFYADDTIVRLKQAKITHVLVNISNLPSVLSAPIGKYLKEVYRIDGVDEVLFKVEYPANLT
jgi:4-amino-4-deoxy-L-arabinose transferase-like glycosyltransferase